MSENENKLEQDEKVKLGVDDAEAIRSFCTIFKIPCTPQLEEAIDKFKVDPNIYTQKQVKLHLMKWLLTSEHPAMKHALFALPRENAAKQLPPLEFDDLLKEKLDE